MDFQKLLQLLPSLLLHVLRLYLTDLLRHGFSHPYFLLTDNTPVPASCFSRTARRDLEGGGSLVLSPNTDQYLL